MRQGTRGVSPLQTGLGPLVFSQKKAEQDLKETLRELLWVRVLTLPT